MSGVPPDLGKQIRHLGRYQQMVSVLMRYGFGFLFSARAGISLPALRKEWSGGAGEGADLARLGSSIRLALTELGPTYVKMGQLVSTRADVIPTPIIRELEQLQDRVQPIHFEEVRKVLEAELNCPLREVFADFNPNPMAAASIGQVHQAVLKDGERVAVKVQRPYLQQTVETDLEILGNLVHLIEERTAWGEEYPLTGMFEEFERVLLAEMDYTVEGQNADKLRKAVEKNRNVKIPKVYWQLTTKRVLTLEYLSGITLNQLTRLEQQGYARRELAVALSDALLEQILVRGVFHGDPHPGNVLVQGKGKLAFVDFGILGELTPAMRRQFGDLVQAVLRKKGNHMVKAVLGMGKVPRGIDRGTLRRELEEVRKRHLEVPIRAVSFPNLLRDFLNVASRHKVRIPSGFLLVGKSLMTLEGNVHELDPALSIMDLAKPLRRKLVWDRLRPASFFH